jgi:signal transduction histidine kinase
MTHVLVLGAPDADTTALASMLEAQGYQADTTCDLSHTGVAPDLLVLDARAPHEAGGLDLLAELRADPALGALPLLLVGAAPDADPAVSPDLTLAEADGPALGAACQALERLAPTLAQLRGALRHCDAEVERRVQLDRQKDEFISLMSHELKNPMASIKGYADLMRRRASKSPNDPNIKGLDVISQQVARMTALLDQLLDFSRISMNRLQLNYRYNDLGSLVERAVDMVRLGTDVPIRLELVDPDLATEIDDARILQVLTGVVGNAVKFSPGGAEVLVRVEREPESEGASARISVRDRGIGIPPADLERVFEQFYRASNASSAANGMGLGLFVAQDIVERHGGQIMIESALGRGTLVTIHLPLVTERELTLRG